MSLQCVGAIVVYKWQRCWQRRRIKMFEDQIATVMRMLKEQILQKVVQGNDD